MLCLWGIRATEGGHRTLMDVRGRTWTLREIYSRRESLVFRWLDSQFGSNPNGLCTLGSFVKKSTHNRSLSDYILFKHECHCGGDYHGGDRDMSQTSLTYSTWVWFERRHRGVVYRRCELPPRWRVFFFQSATDVERRRQFPLRRRVAALCSLPRVDSEGVQTGRGQWMAPSALSLLKYSIF